jgi:hypothetical protein
MDDAMDIVELANELASIATVTTDPATARRSLEIVERLLAEAGLSRDEDGGGEPPTGWLSGPSCASA